MVGSLQSPNSKKEEKENLTNPCLSLLGLEDLSFSYTDSFLDFDYIKDWIEENPEPYNKGMASDLRENPVGFNSEKVAFVMFDESTEMGSTGLVGEEGGNLGPLGQENVEFVGAEKGSEMGCQRFCEKIEVEEGIEGGGGVKLGGLGSSIEEEMGKVCLDGGSSDLILDVGGVSGIQQDGEDCGNGNSENKSGCDVVRSFEAAANVIGTGGMESGVVVSFGSEDARSNDIMTVDKTGEKSGKNGSDGDDSDSDNDSESESDSKSESSSSSSASSSSSGSSDEEEEEEGDGKGKRGNWVKEREREREREEMDMEEGEIVASDPEEMVAWSDEDEGGSGIATLGPPMSKNELKALPPVPPVNVTLQPHHQTQPVGAVLSVVGAQVIVEGVEKHNPLNEGSILWVTETRSPLGLVDEIFGPVKNPYYIVRYNSESEVPAGIQPGTLISFVPEFANHVLNDKSLYAKGYDASGANDEELLEGEEFSDDEKEAEYRKMLKNKKRGTNDDNVGNKKKDEKRFGNWSRNSKYDSTGNRHLPMEGAKQQVYHSGHREPPTVVPRHQGNGLQSSSLGQGLPCLHGLAPPFALLASTSGFNAFSGGANGIPFQQPQTVGFPGLPTNGTPTVRNPNHVGRYNSEIEVPAEIQPGPSLSFVPEFKNHVFSGKSLYEEGYDASEANASELLEDKKCSEYEEADYRQMLKNQNRGKNDGNFGNKQKGGMKIGNWSRNWKNDPAGNPQVPLEGAKLAVDHTKHHVPPMALPPDLGNGSFSGLGQALACQPGLAPPFAQLALTSGFCASSGGANAIPFQQPPSFGIPQLPPNVMPWVQQINQLHQMPSQNILPFQQQINATPNLPANLVLTCGQSGFGAEPAFLPSPACLGQNTFNHSPFGMGTPGQQSSFPITMGEQAAPSNISETRYNHDSHQHTSFSGKPDTSQSFSHGKHYRGGKKAHRRGGGQFRGGRGRR